MKASKELLNNPHKGTLTKVCPDTGDVVRYYPTTNTFGVMSNEGTPRTMFKPDPSKYGFSSNLDDFNAQ